MRNISLGFCVGEASLKGIPQSSFEAEVSDKLWGPSNKGLPKFFG